MIVSHACGHREEIGPGWTKVAKGGVPAIAQILTANLCECSKCLIREQVATQVLESSFYTAVVARDFGFGSDGLKAWRRLAHYGGSMFGCPGDVQFAIERRGQCVCEILDLFGRFGEIFGTPLFGRFGEIFETSDEESFVRLCDGVVDALDARGEAAWWVRHARRARDFILMDACRGALIVFCPQHAGIA